MDTIRIGCENDLHYYGYPSRQASVMHTIVHLPSLFKQRLVSGIMMRTVFPEYTYVLSYVGRSDLPRGIAERVQEVEMYPPTHLHPLSFVAFSNDNLFILNCLQSWPEENLVKELVRLLNENNIHASYVRCNDIIHDHFAIREMPHLR